MEKTHETDNQKKGGSNPSLSGNHFKYLCVLDFEAQCIENQKLKVQEIIEFPVVVIDVEQKEITEVFHQYVKPTENPQLFPFCTSLTGITQDKVDTAKTLDQVLEDLHAFFKENGILESTFCFVTCGDWDLSTGLRKEAEFKNIELRPYLTKWINLKKVYPMDPSCSEKKRGMIGLLKLSHLELEGRQHSGIDDAMNIARVAIYLLKTKFKFSNSMVANIRY